MARRASDATRRRDNAECGVYIQLAQKKTIVLHASLALYDLLLDPAAGVGDASCRPRKISNAFPSSKPDGAGTNRVGDPLLDLAKREKLERGGAPRRDKRALESFELLLKLARAVGGWLAVVRPRDSLVDGLEGLIRDRAHVLRERLVHELDLERRLEHAAHSEALDLGEGLERDTRELLDEAAQRARDKWPRRLRHLSVHEHKRKKRVVDERVYLCASARTGSDISVRYGSDREHAPVGFGASYQSTMPPRTPVLIILATSALFRLT